jgi:hypothetical protein
MKRTLLALVAPPAAVAAMAVRIVTTPVPIGVF